VLLFSGVKQPKILPFIVTRVPGPDKGSATILLNLRNYSPRAVASEVQKTRTFVLWISI
jgi:hypothetical protein